VLVNDLKKRGNLGRDGIYGLLRELRSSGYVRFERNRDVQGRMRSSSLPGWIRPTPSSSSTSGRARWRPG
jgi:hypothetical protein